MQCSHRCGSHQRAWAGIRTCAQVSREIYQHFSFTTHLNFFRVPHFCKRRRGRRYGNGGRCKSRGVVALSYQATSEVISCTQYDAGFLVVVSKGFRSYQVEVIADKPRPGLMLHWAINDWEKPPSSVRPPGTVDTDGSALQTPFDGGEYVKLTFAEAFCPAKLVFVVKDGDTWINDNGADFSSFLKPSSSQAAVLSKARARTAPQEPEVLSCTRFKHGISVVVGKQGGAYQVVVMSETYRPGLTLHWGVEEWGPPPEGCIPFDSVHSAGAVQTTFTEGKSVFLRFPEAVCPSRLVFVLKDGDDWIKDGEDDFVAPLKKTAEEIAQESAAQAAVAQGGTAGGPATNMSCVRYDAGVSVVVGKGTMGYQVVVLADPPRPGLVLHWAVDNWAPPPELILPPETVQVGEDAVQTPFKDGESVFIRIPEAICPSRLVFVLKEGETWIKDGEEDFVAPLKPGGSPVLAAAAPVPQRQAAVVASAAPSQLLTPQDGSAHAQVVSRSTYQEGVAVTVSRGGSAYGPCWHVDVTADPPRPDLVLHWAVDNWELPQAVVLPPGTQQVGEAMQSAFKGGKGVGITFPEAVCPSRLVFVLKEGETWIKDGEEDFTTHLKPPAQAQPALPLQQLRQPPTQPPQQVPQQPKHIPPQQQPQHAQRAAHGNGAAPTPAVPPSHRDAWILGGTGGGGDQAHGTNSRYVLR